MQVMRRGTWAVTAVVLVALAAPGAAGAASDIEGTWSFNGGTVVVAPGSGGALVGTITRQTTLATCPHTVGEQMWTGLRRQADGQWFGGHQWYQNAGCVPIATRGNTAFRVLRRPDGKVLLRVCFAEPDLATTQPRIAADGSSTNAPDGCLDSDLLAAAPSFANTVVLPKQGAKKCLSRRSFAIRLREPQGDPLVGAQVFVNGRRVRVITGARLTAPVRLTGLPRGRYTVRITATTTSGRVIQGTRTYRTCTPKRSGGGRIKV